MEENNNMNPSELPEMPEIPEIPETPETSNQPSLNEPELLYEGFTQEQAEYGASEAFK